MNTRFWAGQAVVLLVLVVATVIVALNDVDLRATAFFYQAAGWPIGEQFPWKLLYRIDRLPAVLVATGWLVVALWSLRRPDLIPWRRAAVFMVLLLILGPGVVVNSLSKEYWGRPRPREVMEFGGNRQFLQPWQPAFGIKGRSFPSGHSSAAFYLATPWFVYRQRKPKAARYWLFGGLGFGVLMSIARIAQGGHFVTDCIWAFGMVWLTGLALKALLLERQENSKGIS